MLAIEEKELKMPLYFIPYTIRKQFCMCALCLSVNALMDIHNIQDRFDG